MTPGYKARSLFSLERKGLPTQTWRFTHDVEEAVEACSAFSRRFDGRWACRVDAPENTGKILPLFGSNKNTPLKELHMHLMWTRYLFPTCSFVCSEAPDDATRDSNIVAWMRDDGVMLCEMGLEPMTLRDAWTKGKLRYYGIDDSARDYFRNRDLTQERVEYLRTIRHLIEPFRGEEFEISVTHEKRIIFWQSLIIKDDRDWIVFKHL